MNKIAELDELEKSQDVVLEEIWRIKDDLSTTCGHDLDKLFAEARARQKTSGHTIVDFSTEAR